MPSNILPNLLTWSGVVKDSKWQLQCGDATELLKTFPDETFSACITSPPYFWQRDYGVKGQIGHEESISEYVNNICTVMKQVYRTLDRRGVLFLNLGDTYYSGKGSPHGSDKKHSGRRLNVPRAVDISGLGVPKKSLIGIPWRVALQMIEEGWILRSPIVWRRPYPMPEPSVDDRPWKTYEHVFMLVKSRDNWFDRSPLIEAGVEDVWLLPCPSSRRKNHPAVFPAELVDRCIDLLGITHGNILDPFAGSATTVKCAIAKGFDATGIDLNKSFCEKSATEIVKDSPAQ